jgi:O-antigen/teichoic acid export membrane protein
MAAFVFSLGQNIALSRLLTPSDFGLLGMIWTVLGLTQLFADAGISNVLLFRQQVSRGELSSILWLNLFVTAILSGLMLAIAPGLVFYFREPRIAELMPWAALAFLISCSGTPLRTLVQKDLRFSELAWSEIAAGAASLAGSVAVAIAGYGVYALLAASLASASIKLLFYCFALRHNLPFRWHFRYAEVSSSFNFGLYQLGDRIANYTWSNLDYLLIGRFLGAEALGYYRLAYETALRPLSLVNPIFNSVAYPLFARKQNDLEAMRRGYLDMISFIAFLVLPLMAGLAVTAYPVVEIVFGKQWLPAVPVLQILCLLSALRCLQNPIGALVIARGMPQAGFQFNAGLLVLNLIFFPLALLYNLEVLAWTAVFTTAASMALLWKPVYTRTIELPASDWLRRVSMPAIVSTLMGGAVWTLYQWLPELWPSGLNLGLAVGAGALLYSGLYWRFDPEFVGKFLRMVRGSES